MKVWVLADNWEYVNVMPVSMDVTFLWGFTLAEPLWRADLGTLYTWPA